MACGECYEIHASFIWANLSTEEIDAIIQCPDCRDESHGEPHEIGTPKPKGGAPQTPIS